MTALAAGAAAAAAVEAQQLADEEEEEEEAHLPRRFIERQDHESDADETRRIPNVRFPTLLPRLEHTTMSSSLSSSDGEEDADASVAIPDDRVIVAALRKAVEAWYEDDEGEDVESLTVNKIRARVEGRLELEEGFLRTDEKWARRTKEVVKDEVVCAELSMTTWSSNAICVE